MKKGYLAGPLFSSSEKNFNSNLKRLLSPFVKIYLPQEDGLLLAEVVKTGMPPEEAKRKIFSGDINAIDECDIFIAILDGRTIDEGVCFELGYAYSKKKICVALKTDPRQLLQTGDNPMIEGALHKIFETEEELLEWVKSHSS